MISLKMALDVLKRFGPEGKASLPWATISTNVDGDNVDATIATNWHASLHCDVDVEVIGGGFSFFPSDIPVDTVKFVVDGPMIVATRRNGAIARFERHPEIQEISRIDRSLPSRQSYRLAPEHLAIASALQKMPNMRRKDMSVSWSSGFHMIHLTVRGGEICGGAGAEAYALKIIGPIVPVDKDDWDILVPFNAVSAMSALPPQTWDIYTGAGEVLANGNDCQIRWTHGTAVQWRSVAPSSIDPMVCTYELDAAKFVDAAKSAGDVYCRLDFWTAGQLWTFYEPSKKQSLRVDKLTIEIGSRDGEPERTVRLDPKLVLRILDGVPAGTPVTIGVKTPTLPVCIRSPRARRDVQTSMIGVVMPVRP